ncbi:MAG: c-type cytochrome [Rhodomicrobium sp.]
MKKLVFAMVSALAIGVAFAQAAEVQKADPSKVSVDPEGKKHQWMTEGGERDASLKLVPDLEHGKEVYEVCAACHLPEGWGRTDGTFPELAGQHRTVLIKQLTDIREGNRDNPTMYPFALTSEIGGEQSVADVTEYISKLPMNPENGYGPGTDLAHGKKLYDDNCVRCHGETGAGDAAKYYPRIQGQHYAYLLRQYKWIKEGRRRNANPDMMEQIKNFSDKDTIDVLDYVSRLQPPKEIVGAKGWKNPDFK